jgi:hypothetical protein
MSGLVLVVAIALNLAGLSSAEAEADVAPTVLACPANSVTRYGVDPNALANNGGGTQLITEIGATYSSKVATFTAWNKGANGCWAPAALPGQPAMPYQSELGYNGLIDQRHESDGATPTGMYDFLSTFYGNSAVDPNPAYTYHHLVCGDWWDEDSSDPQYNLFMSPAERNLLSRPKARLCGLKPSHISISL